eukprot:Gb_00541 [translate_table: standard]
MGSGARQSARKKTGGGMARKLYNECGRLLANTLNASSAAILANVWRAFSAAILANTWRAPLPFPGAAVSVGDAINAYFSLSSLWDLTSYRSSSPCQFLSFAVPIFTVWIRILLSQALCALFFLLHIRKTCSVTTLSFIAMVESGGRLFLAMECQDQEVDHKRIHAGANGSSNSFQHNKENGKSVRSNELRQRNGVVKPDDRQCNGQSRRFNGKSNKTASSARKALGISRKKSRNGLNGIHENGINLRNSQVDDSREHKCMNRELRMVANPSMVSQEAMENSSARDDAESSASDQSQDADYSYMPGLNDELALLCLAHTSRAEYGKLFSINKRYLALAQSGELYKIRRKEDIAEQWVYMLASGQFEWQAFDPFSRRWGRLPNLPSDSCFASSDKESLCAGTHLLVLGREIEGLVIWRYDLVTNKWYKGPAMLTPRCLYASASCGNFAFVAGGISANGELLNCAERYDPDNQRWEPLPHMNKERKLCSGCYMDGKFYVIGGTGVDGDLTCGEVYDSDKKTWELIENIKPSGARNPISQAPPLVAVANNELYALEASMNQLKVYMKRTNEWKVLGDVPVRADFNSGWGVAFKSLGDELLLIGGGRDTYQNTYGSSISIYTSRPDPNGPEADWRFLTSVAGSIGPFVFNCAIMAT